MRKIVSLLLVAALCFTVFGGCKQGSGAYVEQYTDGMKFTETSKGDVSPLYAVSYDFIGGKDVMPIGGFYAPFASGGSVDGNERPSFLTDRIFDALNKCGINAMFYSVDRWDEGGSNTNLNKALDLCEKYKIGYYVDTFYVMGQIGTRTINVPLEDMTLNKDTGKKRLQDMINDITDDGSRKCVLGLMGLDEPFPSQLDNLSVVHDAFYGLENTKNMDVYGNAISYWQGEDNLYGTSEYMLYDEYINDYFENVKPPMLSVTQYPFTSPDTPESVVTALLYNQLSVYRKYAQQFKVPFWRMLQSGGQWNDLAEWIPSTPPYPSEGELLFDVNISLAYGAKAIQYFPLVQPLHFAYEEGGKYDFENRNGLIGADGNLTRWYYYAQRANNQVKAVDEYLMNATNMGIIVNGDKAVDAIVTNGESGDEIIESKSFKELKEVAGDDSIVGCFDYKGGTALYVVNYNRTKNADISLTFDKNDYRYKVIQRANTSDVVGGKMVLTLEPGEGALVVLS